MHAKFRRAAMAGGAAGALALAGLGSAQAAMAKPSPQFISVPCSASALSSDITSANDGSTLRLAHNCTYVLTSALPDISNDLTITGDGTATIERSYANSTPEFGLLYIEDGADFVLSDVNLRNGNDGGDYGAALYNEDGDVTINGGTMSGNTTTEYGGAIYNDTGDMSVNNTTFTGNSGEWGGAIYNDDELTVNGATFTGNTATADGGAIFSETGEGYLTVDNSVFTKNTASTDGGGIEVYSAGATLNHNSFSKEQAEDGGDVYNNSASGDPVTMTADTSSDSTASEYGGGIYNASTGHITINGGTFTYDYAGDYGGAVENMGHATANNVNFYGNGARYYGGAIYSETALTVKGTSGIFTGNTAEYGGAIYKDSGTATVTGNQFNGNSGSDDGGAIYNAAGALTVNGGSSITDNWGYDGGGIYNGGTATVTGSQVIWNHPDNCAGTAVTGCTG